MVITTYNLYQDDVSKHPTLVANESVEYTKTDRLDSPAKISQMMHDLFNADKLAEENLWLLPLTAAMRPLGLLPVSHGTITEAPADMKSIAIRLILCGAPTFIALVHNHPGGDPALSDADLHLLKKTKKLLEGLSSFLNIKLLDFLVLGENGTFYNIREKINE